MVASVSQSLRSALNDFPSDVGKEEYSITHLEGDSVRLYAKIPTDQIYKETMLSSLNFLSSYKIKSLENEVPLILKNKQRDVYLRSREAIRKHKCKYDFLHIGLVQACFEPLGLGVPDIRVLVCLRNSKFPNFKDSVLAAFEISLGDDASKFNWFPNFSSLSDLVKSNVLVITIKAHDYNLAKASENSSVLGISYRICYKLMNGALEPKSLFENPLLEFNTDKTQVLVPKPNTRN